MSFLATPAGGNYGVSLFPSVEQVVFVSRRTRAAAPREVYNRVTCVHAIQNMPTRTIANI